MAAVLKIYIDFGGSDTSPGTSHDTTSDSPSNVRLKTADDATIDANNVIPIPASSVNNSFWKSCYAKCSTAPNTQINNLKIYSGGTPFGTGISTKIGNQFPTKNHSSSSGYKVAVGTTGTSGTDAVTNGYLSSYSDLFSFTSGSPLSGPTISESGNIIVNIGDTSNYFVLQAIIGTTAAPGTQTPATITLQYDEI